MFVVYSSRIAEVNRNVEITAYANTDTQTVLFDFEEHLQIEISTYQATVTATTPGIYRGEVCAVADDVFGCESIVVEFTSVEEKEVVPTTNFEPEERSSYFSQLSKNSITIVILSIIMLLVVLLGWKRPKASVEFENHESYDSSVPTAPDLSMWLK